MSPSGASAVATVVTLLALFGVGTAWGQAPRSFAELQPILDERCVMCHTGDAAPLGLRLNSRDGLLAGSDRGPVVVPGSPETSELVRRLRGESQPRMPLTGPPYLSEEEIRRFERWIADLPEGEGAPGGANGVGDAEPARPPRDPEATTDPGDGAAPTYLDVRPIFTRNCVRCHAREGVMGSAPEGYRLDTYEETVRAADRLRVVPGRPEASELARRIRGQARPRMPFDGPPFLSDEEIDVIVTWIEAGARDANGTPAPSPAGAEVRLHGTWRADGTLDGLELAMAADARIDDDARTGGYVQVRGVIDEDFRVRVERIRGR